MRRHVPTLAVALTLLLAGCLSGAGSPGVGTATSEGPAVTPGQPPGVSDGRLTNASALAAANADRLGESGFVAVTNRSFGGGETFDHRVVAAPEASTYALRGSRTVGESSSGVRIWGNESVGVVRLGDGPGASYRTRPRGYDVVGDLVRLDQYLRAGEYTVANETDDGKTVLVADTYAPVDGHGPFAEASPFHSRLVTDGSGLVHELHLTATTPNGEISVSYSLERLGTERVDRPAWIADVPSDVFLHPELRTDVVNGSYLEVSNAGDDPLPAGSVVSVTTNGTTYEATVESALESGDRRYAYVTDDGTSLALSADRPEDGAMTPLTSPVSITISTESGTTVHSGGIGWGTATASESGGGGGNATAGAGSSG